MSKKLRNNFGVGTSNLLSVSQAATILGVTDKTVKAWCESGSLPSITTPYGSKTTCWISFEAIEWFNEQREKRKTILKKKQKLVGELSNLVRPWQKAMLRGVLTGRAFSQRTVDNYSAYLTKHLTRHSVLTIRDIKEKLMRIPPQMYAKRDNYYRGVCSFAKFLVQEGIYDSPF